jgi:hypothetical protein
MGSCTYDFLTESFLFEDSLLEEAFASVSDSALADELKRYREFVLSNQQNLVAEVTRAPSNLRVFSGLDRVHLSHLK